MVGEDQDRGPAARKKRPPLVTPDQAVQAAYQLIAAEGPQGLSMRKLAAVLHVSLPTVYTAIRSKDHLIGKLQDRLFIEITSTITGTDLRGARERLLSMGQALFAWADEHPRLAEFLLHEDASDDISARAAESAPEPGRSAVVGLVSELVGAEDAAKLDPVTAVLFASAVSRALLALARSTAPVERDRWLTIWADTITNGLRSLADRSAVRA